MKILKNEKNQVSWRAAEHEHVEKEVSWYWLVGTIAALLIMLALWQRNFFFLVFLFVVTPMMFFFGRRKPRILLFSVNDKGVGLGKETFYPYTELEGYHVLEREGALDEIVFKRKAAFNPFFRVLVDTGTRKEAEKRFLEEHLNYIDYEPGLLDIVSEWIGF